MPGKPLSISLVIPVHNEERYLEACLQAIAGQTKRPLEVIVVDNNSSDATRVIAERFPFVRVIAEPRQGTVYARNTGFAAAHGDIIARIDADTILSPDWIATCQTYFAAHQSKAAVTGRAIFYDAPLPRLFGSLQVMMYQYLQYPAAGSFCLWGANMAIRRSVWRTIATACSEDDVVDEDIDLTLTLERAGFRIGYSKRLRVAVSLQRGQLSPNQLRDYLATWPKNYQLHQRTVALVWIKFLTGYCMAVAVPSAWIYQRLVTLRAAIRLIVDTSPSTD